jgi:hypothetical protein
MSLLLSRRVLLSCTNMYHAYAKNRLLYSKDTTTNARCNRPLKRNCALDLVMNILSLSLHSWPPRPSQSGRRCRSFRSASSRPQDPRRKRSRQWQPLERQLESVVNPSRKPKLRPKPIGFPFSENRPTVGFFKGRFRCSSLNRFSL